MLALRSSPFLFVPLRPELWVGASLRIECGGFWRFTQGLVIRLKMQTYELAVSLLPLLVCSFFPLCCNMLRRSSGVYALLSVIASAACAACAGDRGGRIVVLSLHGI